MSLSVKLIGTLGGLLSPGGRNARLPVLTYHRVLSEPDPLLSGEVDCERFRMQLETLANGFLVLPLATAVDRLRAGELPARAVSITFDDGYASNAHLGLPLLREYGFTATFFIATGFLNGGRMFNDTVIESVRRLSGEVNLSELGLGTVSIDDDAARSALIERILGQIKHLHPSERSRCAECLAELAAAPLPDDLMMNDDDVRVLHQAGMEIGGHTVTHPILASIDESEARSEIVEGKRYLEALCSAPITSFAYPNGRPGVDYGPEHVRLVAEAGFERALTTAWGAAHGDDDVYQLPRLSSWDRSPQRFSLRLLRACREPRAVTV